MSQDEMDTHAQPGRQAVDPANIMPATASLGDLMGLEPAKGQAMAAKDSPPAAAPVADGLASSPAAPPARSTKPPSAAGAFWLHTPLQQDQQVLEAFRNLKNKLVSFRSREQFRTFLLTGTESGVGVSTVVGNLALVLGMDLSDQRILLVDANLSVPSLHRHFGLAGGPGLMDHLFGGVPEEEIICDTTLPNLKIIAAGETGQGIYSPFELSKFSAFLTQQKRHFDFILFDSAPALRSSHTRNLSLHVDGVVVVAEANRTHWEVLTELQRQLADDGGRLLGGFLNKRRFVIPRWLYRFI